MLYSKFLLVTIGVFLHYSAFSAQVDIDCDNLPQPLQQIIDDVPEDSIIKFYGTCHEPIKIKKDRLSILGMFGAKFVLSPNNYCGIAISGRQIEINRITIFGGESGIVVYRSGSLNISDSRILNPNSIGVEVTGSSYARITQTEIVNSHRNGIVVRLSSSADIHANTINRNKGYAIVIDNSSADIDGNIISENYRYGIYLRDCSKIRLGGDNASGEGNIFYGNLIGGIRCESNSTIEIRADQKFDTDKNNYDLSDSCVLRDTINDPIENCGVSNRNLASLSADH
ncbi:MAG TPA: hypothetical protein DEP36_01875 [Gammaproteobacteria bacterium]|mgnify:FL=1|nr:hypothetical protein [Gammaproteobacteria bacterium]HRF44006.1 right-handed parallel beta-helix repeat-containing protein [Candidatus Competibacteraceae bacterium]